MGLNKTERTPGNYKKNAAANSHGGLKDKQRPLGVRRRKLKRKRQIKIAGAVVLSGAAVILLVFQLGKSFNTNYEPTDIYAVLPTKQAATDPLPEIALNREVFVDGIDMSGMSRSEVEEQLKKLYPWNITLNVEGNEMPLDNLLAGRISQLADDIFTVEEQTVYSLNLEGIEAVISAEADKLAAKYDIAPQNGRLSGYDKESGNFLYESEKNGKKVNQEQLAAAINNAVQTKDFDRTIKISFDTAAPARTMEETKKLYGIIGTFTTKTTSNKDRNTNIQLASEAINGMIVKPGEEFSFNLSTGNRTLEKGYRPAGAYVNGILVEEPGGGVCQVSTTLFNAAVKAGLNVVERHPHSYAPAYIPSGEDAMVSYDGYSGPDLRILNISDENVAVRAKFENQTLVISIIGMPILDSGIEVKFRSEKIDESNPPAPVYEEDRSLAAGVEVVAKEAVNGNRWQTYLLTLKDGQVIKEEPYHKSGYKGKAATIKRNTSGIVVPKETTAASHLPTSAETTAANPPVPETSAALPETSAGTPETKPAGPGTGPGVESPQTRPGSEPSTVPAVPETSASKPAGPGVGL